MQSGIYSEQISLQLFQILPDSSLEMNVLAPLGNQSVTDCGLPHTVWLLNWKNLDYFTAFPIVQHRESTYGIFYDLILVSLMTLSNLARV